MSNEHSVEASTIARLEREAATMRAELAALKAELLRPAHDRFERLVASVRDYAIFMLDTSGRVVSWNEGARLLKGYEPHEIIGQSFERFYSEKEIARGHPQWELAQADLVGTYHEEDWRIRKDGTRFWASVVITAMRGETGELIGFSKVTRDLTHRKRAEEDLRKSQGFLDSVIENIPAMVFIKDARDLRFVRFNRAGEELIGYSRADLIGKNDYDFFPRELADLFVAKDREVLAGRHVVVIPDEPIETRHQGRRSLRTRKIPILGEDGLPAYLLGISEDITEWKIAEQDRLRVIREQAAIEERNRQLVRETFLAEASTALAGSLDYHETLRVLSQTAVSAFADWCTVTMQRPDCTLELMAITHRDPSKVALVEELERSYPTATILDRGVGYVIQSGKSIIASTVSEAELSDASRDPRHLSMMRELGCHSYIVSPICARGRVLGAVAVMSARSDHHYSAADLAMIEELGRRAGIAADNAYLFEQAQNAIRARDEFLSIASHELKTPLTSLKLNAQLRLREVRQKRYGLFAHERLPEMFRDDERQINRLICLVDDMLDVSRVQSGKLSLVSEDFDLNEMVIDTLARFSSQIEASHATVTFVPGPTAVGHWDRMRIEQVFVNLLTNALKYGDRKPILVKVKVLEEKVILRVCDQGIGIVADDHERIFGQFERAVSANFISGLGLGLYISRSIVADHGGRVWVESESGQGSTFIVELPLRK